MRIAQVNYVNTNLSNGKKNNKVSIRRGNVNNNPAFKATFKSTGIGLYAGTKAGLAIGAKLEAMTGFVSCGTIAATCAVLGSLGGTIAGFLTGSAIDDAAERRKLENSIRENEEKIRLLNEKNRIIELEKQKSDARQRLIREEQQRVIEKQKNELKILNKFDYKKLEEKNGVGLGKLAGYEEDKEALYQAFINPYIQSYKYKNYEMDVPNGVLLYGISGNGKTALSKAIIEEISATTNSNFYNLSTVPVDDLPKELNVIEEKAKADFENEHKRTIVFIDEFDRYALDSTRIGYNPESTGYLKTFMNDCAKKGITILATTNNPQHMAEPFVINNRRFSIRTMIEPPSKNDIKKILQYYLKGLTEGEIDYDSAVKCLQEKALEKGGKYSCSEIENLAEQMKIKAKKEKRLVTQNDIDAVVKKSIPNIRKEQMERFKKDFECISCGTTYEKYLLAKDDEK